MVYTPGNDFPFTKDNNDFTYIEHGFYHKQLLECFRYFDRENVLILDFVSMKKEPADMMQQVYSFLNVDTNFQPDFSFKNITGEVRNKWFQKQLVKNSGFKKWAMKYLVNSWLPAKNRNLLKRKMFEKNTILKKGEPQKQEREILPDQIKNFLVEQYKADVAALDQLLGTDYYTEWLQPAEENDQKS